MRTKHPLKLVWGKKRNKNRFMRAHSNVKCEIEQRKLFLLVIVFLLHVFTSFRLQSLIFVYQTRGHPKHNYWSKLEIRHVVFISIQSLILYIQDLGIIFMCFSFNSFWFGLTDQLLWKNYAMSYWMAHKSGSDL